MKKLFILLLTLITMILILVSCDNSKGAEATSTPESEITSSIFGTTSKEEKKLLEKLKQIEKGWTIEQVKELLGEPDEVPPTGIYREVYHLNATEMAQIMYGGGGVLIISIYNMKTDESITILE